MKSNLLSIYSDVYLGKRENVHFNMKPCLLISQQQGFFIYWRMIGNTDTRNEHTVHFNTR